MIPPHICTPYCDGQRYCVEPGTHTIPMWWREDKTTDDVYRKFVEIGFTPSFIRQESDGMPIKGRCFSNLKQSRVDAIQNPANTIFWLVTVREFDAGKEER